VPGWCQRLEVLGAEWSFMPASSLPDLDVAHLRRWCDQRVPARARHQVRVECELGDRQVTVMERRAPWRGGAAEEWSSLPVARLRYTKASGTWTLYWRDRHSRFHRYQPVGPTNDIAVLIAELERDPTCIFWG